MADYAFYKNEYLGDSIPAEEYPRIAKRANDHLRYYKRKYTVSGPNPNSEAMALCAMADAIYYFETAQSGVGGAVQSANIGSVSVSYAGTGTVDISTKAQEAEIFKSAKLHLDFYRGVY